MKFKSTYLVLTMLGFVVLIFLDQNRTPVPIKIIFGSPFQTELTLVIIISTVIGALITVGAVYLMKKRKDSGGSN